ncbi:MAG: GTPase Era [Gammaproteobacteria bacterium]|nr:MAG: GTPase Era [Gammaproteobacteria bacterium]
MTGAGEGDTSFKCGFVAIVGQPNVGKSTLLNKLIGQKISITSKRPQTTRNRVIGVKTDDRVQIIYIDTPGLHQHSGKILNKYINRAAINSLIGVDIILFMVTAKGWSGADDKVLQKIETIGVPVILAINKIDKLAQPDMLLPQIETANNKAVTFTQIIPVSASTGEGVDELAKALTAMLPDQPLMYPADQVTDRGNRFMAAELIREQVFRQIGEEVPYSVAVQLESFKREGRMLRISAVIWVEKPGQKAILIGKQGKRLKSLGTRAREEMEKLFSQKVFLSLWVKVRENWRDNERALNNLGFGNE